MPLQYDCHQHHWNDNFQPQYTPRPSQSLFFWGMCSAPFPFSSAGILWNHDLKLTLLPTKQQAFNVVNITEMITFTPDIPLDPLDHHFSKVCAVLCFLCVVLVSREIITWNSPFYWCDGTLFCFTCCIASWQGNLQTSHSNALHSWNTITSGGTSHYHRRFWESWYHRLVTILVPRLAMQSDRS
jgi:hypothetical protein